MNNGRTFRLDEEVERNLRAVIVDSIDPEAVLTMPVQELEGTVSRILAKAARDMRLFLNSWEHGQLVRETVDDMVGLGPVQPCMDDDEVSDVLINGPSEVLVERKGVLEKTPYRFRDEQHLMNFAQRIAGSVGRRVDEASPMVDARLADGSRVNIIIPPLALNGVCVSIRKFSRETMSLEQYVEIESLDAPMAEFLRIASRSRLNMLVSGGTGAGKTTLLNALSQHISRSERIVTIEDAAELKLDQPFVVRLETRPPSVEGKGAITQRDLLKNALRMRPDRILLGEVRGEEALDMLQAMNTGHDGSLSTVHANSPADAMLRLENMLNMGAAVMSSTLIRRQLASALDVLVQIERDAKGKRRVTEIAEVVPDETKGVRCEDLYRYVREKDGGHFERTDHMPTFTEKLLAAGTYENCMEVLSCGRKARFA